MDVTNTDVRTEDTLACKPVADVLGRIGEKWTVLVVAALNEEPLRYGQLRQRISGISQRMLTLSLKGLEEDGLVKRTMYSAVPPHVEYELTDLGLSLTGPLKLLYEWAVENHPAIAAARAEFGAKLSDRAAAHAVFFAPK